MSRLVKLAPALAALTFALTASAGGPEIDQGKKPTVKFFATAMGGLTINGTGSSLTASESGGKYVFKASLKDLKTGIALRDDHTQKYLDTKSWPDASFTVAKDKLKLPSGDGKTSGVVLGEFRIHGVSKMQDGKKKGKDEDAPKNQTSYTVKKSGDGYAVTASFPVNILDHGIEKPCYLGVCMNENVKVEVTFTTK